MPAVAGGVQAGLGAIQSVVGLINAGKAKKEAKRLAASRPQYAVSPEAGKELSLTESDLANGGLSSSAENAYNNLNNKQFSGSLDAILKSGGSANSVGQLFGNNEDGRLRLQQLQDQTRMAKINNYVNASRYYTDQTDKAFLYNKDAPWKDAAQANATARANADKMIWSGLGQMGGAAINYGSQKNQSNQFQKYLDTFKGSGGNQSAGAFTPMVGGGDNQLAYNTPTVDPGITPNGGTNYNWFQ